MLDHVSIGVRDIKVARRFYDAALKPLGYECLAPGEDSAGYGRKAIQLWLGQTEHPVKADPKSGLHFCFVADSRKAVDAFYAAAIKSGGKDNGKPGVRADYSANYYAAFVVDPDGYRLEAHCEKTA
ncbi:MAG: VOC family protein [Alphaproteobacteria bacterium]|nr:VOC family protein [Alphaproteobacteria bacterium]